MNNKWYKKRSGEFKKVSLTQANQMHSSKFISVHVSVNLIFTKLERKNLKKQGGLVGRFPKQD